MSIHADRRRTFPDFFAARESGCGPHYRAELSNERLVFGVNRHDADIAKATRVTPLRKQGGGRSKQR